MNENLAAQLEHIQYPTFTFPWSGACAPFAEAVDQEALRWAQTQGLIISEKQLARHARGKYGWLMARCYPHADRELVQLLTDFVLWYFIVDDLFVDRVDAVAQETLPNLTAILDIIDFDHASATPRFGEMAFLGICQRMRARLDPEHFERFAHGIRLWGSAAGLQILCNIMKEPLAQRSYEALRRYVGGVLPCLALCDAANAGKVSAAEYHQFGVQRLIHHTINTIIWNNDIHSMAVETLHPSQVRNMVSLHVARGHTLQEGVDFTARKVREEMLLFQQRANQLEQGASRQLQGFISGLRDWLHGYNEWADVDTQRYSLHHAEQDPDDNGVLLAAR
ncbi:hypothetical protein [Myxococcus sp. AS-1-15]|uniref:terpene synthase family protein n=1 Tax=Myxococcus TaxID=32 RepID=UPI001CBC8E2D|nr:hypothetical protein [Myxococcus sp. AS-1-15]BDT33434.1 sesquiterpene cyclase [Myxococcus sp. MH1]